MRFFKTQLFTPFIVLVWALLGTSTTSHAQCDVDFIFNKCVKTGVPVSFINTSSTAGTNNFLWFVNGNFVKSSRDLLNFSFNTAGTYQVGLTLNDGSCNFPSTQKAVIVVDTFGITLAPDTSHCYGTDLNLAQLLTIEGGTQPFIYDWKTNGSPFSTSDTPIVNVINNQVISLTLKDVNGCLANHNFNVDTLPIPYDNYTFSPDSACANTQLTFSVDNPSPNYNYVWVSSSNHISALTGPATTIIFPPQNGLAYSSYSVELSIIDKITGCFSSISKDVTMAPTPNPVISGNTWDPNRKAFVNCNSSYNSPSKTFNFDNLTVNNSPTPYIDLIRIDWGDGLQDSFDVSGGFWPTTFSHTYSNLGRFTMKIYGYGKNGCVGNRTYTIVNDNRPILGINTISPLTGCGPHLMTFYTSEVIDPNTGNKITELPTPNSKITWSFGDGTTVQWKYSDYLANYDSALGGAVIQHEFNSNTCGTSFSSAGGTVYNNSSYASISVTNYCGQTAGSDIFPIEVCKPPIAAVQVDTVCLGTPSTIKNLSSELCPDKGYLSCYNPDSVTYKYIFGDGNDTTTNSNGNMAYSYSSPGNYDGLLIACNACGCDTIEFQAAVLTNPQVRFTGDTTCFGIPNNFKDKSLNNSANPIISWEWVFDGVDTVLNKTSTSHLFTTTGIHQSQLTITTSNGCKGTKTSTVYVRKNPVAELSGNANCQSDTVQFFDQSSIQVDSNSASYADSLVLWTWVFNSADTSTLANPTYLFDTCGTLPVYLRVEDNHGCFDDTTDYVNVICGPTAKFNTPAVCSGNQSNFTDQSLTINGPIVKWTWDFDDNNATSSIQNPVYSYANTGAYFVNLLIEDSIGCTDNITQPVVVGQAPLPGFRTEGACIGNITTFIDTSKLITSGGSIVSWSWNFGDPSSGVNDTSTAAQPQHTYSSPGKYLVTLTVQDNAGCSATSTDSLTIGTRPLANFDIPNTNFCRYNTYQFNDSSVPVNAPINKWDWHFLYSKDTVQNPLVTFNFGGKINIRLTVTDTNGCYDDTLQSIQVVQTPTAAFGNVGSCMNEPTYFTGNPIILPGGAPVNKYFWDLGNGQNDTTKDAVTTYLNQGVFRVSFTVTDTLGCSSTRAINYSINYKDDVKLIDTLSQCLASFTDSLKFHIQSKTAQGYWTGPAAIMNKWTNPQDSINGPYNPMDLGNGSYTFYYHIPDPSGNCPTIDSLVLDIQPALSVNAGPDTAFCYEPKLYNLDTYVSHKGGNWYGNGIIPGNPNYFSPSIAGVGNHQLIYDFSNGYCADKDTIYVQVHPKPVSQFKYDAACSNDSVKFTNLSTTPPQRVNQYIWRFGDGNISYKSNPKHLYNQNTNYAITFVIEDIYGCADSITKPLQINNAPVANFDYTNACRFDTTEFVDRSQPMQAPIINWEWNINGNAYYNQYPKEVFTTFANFPVTLTITDSNQCTSTITKPFSIKSIPISQFAYDTLCVGTPINFQATSKVTYWPIASYTWIFSDGTDTFMLNNQPFQHKFKSNPPYTVRLETYDSMGCGSDTTITLENVNPPVVDFSFFNGCNSSVYSFHDSTQSSSGTITGWLWTFGDGDSSSLQNPSHSYQGFGTYIVKLEVISSTGCNSFKIDTLQYYGSQLANFTIGQGCNATTYCSNMAIQFSDNSSTSSGVREWDVDSDGFIDYMGLNINHAFTSPGIFDVKMIFTNGTCTDTVIKSITIEGAPTTSFTKTLNTTCSPSTLTLNPTSSGNVNSHAWEIYYFDGVGTKQTVYNSSSSTPTNLPSLVTGSDLKREYFIQLIASNCCGSETALDSVTIHDKPIPGLVANRDTICSGELVSFNANNLTSNNTESIQINYGDNSSDSLSPQQSFPTWNITTHAYQYGGNLADTTIMIEVIAKNFCGDSSLKFPINVKSDKVISFFTTNKTSGCAPLTVSFTDNSSGANNISWNFEWDANNPNGGAPYTSSQQTVSHTYSQAGQFQVAQFAANDCGVDTSYFTITVHPNAQVDFTTPAATCENNVVSFVNNSSISSGNITGYQWDFGDGNTSFAINPSHTYTGNGAFTVKLKTTSNYGCIDSTSKPVTIHPEPTVSFTRPDECLNLQTVPFSNTSSIASGSIVGTLWDFGDGNSSTQFNPQHKFNVDGVFQVELELISNHGCKSKAQKTVRIYPLPQIDFDFSHNNPDTCNRDGIVNFTNLSVNAGGYEWDFQCKGNPGVALSSLSNPQFTYTSAGKYFVHLVGSNQYGCLDTAYSEVVIELEPVVDFSLSATEGCAPLEVSFTDLTTYNTNGSLSIVDWEWNFGNNVYSNVRNPKIYFGSGNHDVSLTVTTETGCKTTITKENVMLVYELPAPQLEAEKFQFGLYQFNANISGGMAPYNTSWNFGDGDISTETNPKHQFQNSSDYSGEGYDVCLTVIDANGCVSDTCAIVKVDLIKTLYVPNAFTPGNGFGEETIWLPKGKGLVEYNAKIFDSWGNLVWETSALNEEDGSPKESWNGTMNGEPLPVGVFTWKIHAVFKDGSLWQGQNLKGGPAKRTGTISLIR